MAFHRAPNSIGVTKPDFVDLESRILSPGRLNSPGLVNAHSFSARRRRAQSLRVCQWLTASLLALCIVASFVRVHLHLKALDEQQHEEAPIDVVGVSLKPSCVTRQAVASLNRYLRPRTIHVVTTNSEKCAIYSSFAPNVVCHLQDGFLEGLTLARVGAFIQQRLGIDEHRHFKGRDLSGWYMQQFMKLGSALALPELSEQYVVWDLDMVLLQPVRILWRHGAPGSSASAAISGDRGLRSETRVMAPSADGAGREGAAGAEPGVQTLVNIGGSISPGYVAAYRRLTQRPLEFAPDGSSFVTHWMVVHKPYMRQFLGELAAGYGSGGGGTAAMDAAGAANSLAHPPPRPDPLAWVWAILSAVDPTTADLGFSEYASYISWVRQRYPASQRLAGRKSWLRHPFGQATVAGLRWLRADRCCCPGWALLRLLRAMGYVYTGYEVGHIEECRYEDARYATAYGLGGAG